MFVKLLLLITFLLSNELLAVSVKNLTSYQANFTQKIVDQDNVVVTYTGIFKAKKPLHALWIYHTPVQKKLYINNRQIVLVEPELEQAIFRESSEGFTLFNLLSNATETKKGLFVKVINEKTYTLEVEGNIIKNIKYIDNFENNVEIIFSKQKANVTLLSKEFHPVIPQDFDILHE